jgi:hypothetical protein
LTKRDRNLVLTLTIVNIFFEYLLEGKKNAYVMNEEVPEFLHNHSFCIENGGSCYPSSSSRPSLATFDDENGYINFYWMVISFPALINHTIFGVIYFTKLK